MEIQTLYIFSSIAVFLFCLMALALFLQKLANPAPNYWLAAYLLLVAWDLSGIILPDFVTAIVPLEIVRRLSALLQMPLFFFYVHTLAGGQISFKKQAFIHCILFLVCTLLWAGYQWGAGGNGHWMDSPDHPLALGVQVILRVQGLWYIFWVLSLLRNKKAAIQPIFNWLYSFTLILLLAKLLTISRTLIQFSEDAPVGLISFILVVISLLLISFIVVRGLQSPSPLQWVFRPVVNGNWNLEGEAPTQTNQGKCGDVLKWVETHQPYTDPDLTLQSLANHVGLSKAELSSIINSELGVHFFDFINAYRVKMAARELERIDSQAPSIKEICYKVGFNSKSSFNAAFKKHTGTTPSAYREQFLR